MSSGTHAGITSAHFIDSSRSLGSKYAGRVAHHRLRCIKARLYCVIHIVISEHAYPACQVKVPESAQVIVKKLALFRIADFKKWICFLRPYNGTSRNIAFFNKPDLLETPDSHIGKV